MKFRKLVLYDLKRAPLSNAFVALLKKTARQLVVVYGDDFSGKLKATHCQGADAVVTRLFDHFEGVLDYSTLRYVGVMATDTSYLPKAELKAHGVVVSNSGAYSSPAVSEMTMAAMLALTRQLPQAAVLTKKGVFGYGSIWTRELGGKRLGVIGLGRIGSRVALLAKAFGMDVVYFSRTRKPFFEHRGVRYLPLASLVKSSDVVALHADLNPSSKGLLSAGLLRQLKTGAVLLNASPAGLVDLPALYARAKTGRVSVWLDEIPDRVWCAKFARLPNCLLTPFSAGSTVESTSRNLDVTLSNVRAFLDGRPQNVVRD